MLFCIIQLCTETLSVMAIWSKVNVKGNIWGLHEDFQCNISVEPINLFIKVSIWSVLICGSWEVFGSLLVYWQWKGKGKAGFWIGVKCFIPTIKSDNGHWAGGQPKIWAVRPWFMVIKFLWQTCGILAGVRVRILLPERALDGRGHRKGHLHDGRRRPGAQSPSLNRWWPG